MPRYRLCRLVTVVQLDTYAWLLNFGVTDLSVLLLAALGKPWIAGGTSVMTQFVGDWFTDMIKADHIERPISGRVFNLMELSWQLSPEVLLGKVKYGNAFR